MGVFALLVVVVGIAAGAVLWLRRRPPPKSEGGASASNAPPAAHRNQAAQWGVRIATPAKDKACPAVRALIGKEYPLAHKPPLPVKDCPFPRECRCHYVKLFDRRKEERRSGHERRSAQRFEEGHGDRRAGKDRRGKPVDWA
jgi:hypothetical protein